MKKCKGSFNKYACNVATVFLTGVIAGVATRGCFFVYYQPKAPEGLKKYSRNR